MNSTDLLATIPPSESDSILNDWGYNLAEEYLQMLEKTPFIPGEPVFEFATGTGRMTSILTRLNQKVITGDNTKVQISEAVKRITPGFLRLVSFILLDIETLPLPDGTIKNITFVNTLHHLRNPEKSINELIRATAQNAVLLFADFNEEGFDVMDKLHMKKDGKSHERINFNWAEIEDLLNRNFQSVNKSATQLNRVFIASIKR